MSESSWSRHILLLTGAMQAGAALLVLTGLIWLVSGALNRWLTRHGSTAA